MTIRARAAAVAAPAVEFNIWRSRSVTGLEIVHTNVHDHAYPAHLHETMEIIWIRSGSGLLHIQNRNVEICAGEAIIVPPNELHGGSTRANMEYVAINLPPALLAMVFVDAAGRPSPERWRTPTIRRLPAEQATSLVPILVQALCAELPVGKLAYILRPILAQMLAAPPVDSALPPPREGPHPAVLMAQSLIRAGCADRLTVRHLARSVDLDMRYLISLFKLATGVTPHQFQIALRVELARSLIEQRLPLCEVAARAGFADQSHLNRHFRRQWGLSPGEFRTAVIDRDGIRV